MAARPPLSLKARALQWLSQREHSRSELRRKLMTAARRRDALAALAAAANARASLDATADADTDTAPSTALDRAAEVDALLDWLAAQRYLSEARFVESRLHARSARFGQRRIAQELAQHGVKLDAASAERLRNTELERARALWARRFGSTPATDTAQRAKQMRFLAGRGFDGDVIRRVVRGADDD
jgi:regulatory protein